MPADGWASWALWCRSLMLWHDLLLPSAIEGLTQMAWERRVASPYRTWLNVFFFFFSFFLFSWADSLGEKDMTGMKRAMLHPLGLGLSHALFPASAVFPNSLQTNQFATHPTILSSLEETEEHGCDNVQRPSVVITANGGRSHATDWIPVPIAAPRRYPGEHGEIPWEAWLEDPHKDPRPCRLLPETSPGGSITGGGSESQHLATEAQLRATRRIRLRLSKLRPGSPSPSSSPQSDWHR